MNAINKTTASIAAAITCVGVSYLLSKNNPNNQYPHKHWHQHPQQNFFFKGSLDLCILYWHGYCSHIFFHRFIFFLDIIYKYDCTFYMLFLPPSSTSSAGSKIRFTTCNRAALIDCATTILDNLFRAVDNPVRSVLKAPPPPPPSWCSK